jgi:molybdopterin-containing oxidoreductase family membrane subunit
MFSPTWVDIGFYLGTFGLFFTLYLLFAKYFPVVAVAEIKHVLKVTGNNPNREDDLKKILDKEASVDAA